MLSRNDIEQALADGHLKIFPFEKKSLTGIGYNLSTTDFAFSVNRGILLTVHRKTANNKVMRYVIIPAQDTVLFFSKEYIEVDKTLAGTFHSKVSVVSLGLGHISTTLDPTWKGQLLISVNNPTARDIVFDLDKSGGNILTLLLHKLDSDVTGINIHDNNKGRCELLISHFENSPSAPRYWDKHLELKEFVQKALADSLNGYDSFLGADRPQDRYSQKVKQLMELKARLDRDRNIILEDRYELGPNGKYSCVRNSTELDLIKSCALYEFKPELDQIDFQENLPARQFSAEQLAQALPMIDAYIEVIEYELAMIDHSRRIQWQNDQVNQFAGEDSELVRMRQANSRSRRRIRFWLPLLGIVALTVLFFWLSLKCLGSFFGNNNISVVSATLYAPFLVFLIQAWLKYWRD